MDPSPAQADETLLIRAMAAGEEWALGRAYDLFGSLVYSLAIRILGNPAHAEEVLQDVFLKLWNRSDTFDPQRGSLTGLLVTMTRRRAIDRVRAQRARPDSSGWSELSTAPPRLETPLDAAAIGDARACVRTALAELPDEERRVLELAYFDGLSQTEIAERTGSPLGTVKGRARNGMRRMREALPQGLGGDA